MLCACVCVKIFAHNSGPVMSYAAMPLLSAPFIDVYIYVCVCTAQPSPVISYALHREQPLPRLAISCVNYCTKREAQAPSDSNPLSPLSNSRSVGCLVLL